MSEKHLPGCPAAAFAARPPSQRLIGPRCACKEVMRQREVLRRFFESDEGKALIRRAAQEITRKSPQKKEARMSDIDLLKWLRELAQEPEFVERWPDYCPFTEAADEIEQLRVNNELLLDCVEYYATEGAVPSGGNLARKTLAALQTAEKEALKGRKRG